MWEKAPVMVRFAVLAALVAACFAAAPSAQAAILGVDVQSTAAATVAEAPALAEAPSVAQVATTVTNVARPVVSQLGTHAEGTTGSGTGPAVGNATGIAKPAVEQAGYTAATVTGTPSDGSGELRETASAATHRPAPHRSSFTRQKRGHEGTSAAPRGDSAALASPARSTPAPTPVAPSDLGTSSKRPAAQHHPATPDPVAPAAGGTAATAPAAAFAFGGLALLAVAVCLAGPRLRRRLVIRPATLRPVAFVVLLERPG